MHATAHWLTEIISSEHMPAFLDNPDSDLKKAAQYPCERARISTSKAERIFQASGGSRIPAPLSMRECVWCIWQSVQQSNNYVKGVFDDNHL